MNFSNIPEPYLNELARIKKVKWRNRDSDDIVKDLIDEGYQDSIEYLDEQFKFSASYISLLEPTDKFPEKSKTPEDFIANLIKEEKITREQLALEAWEPSLDKYIKICAIKHEGSSVYINLVLGKESYGKDGYKTRKRMYAHITPVVLHFGSDEKIQLRCAARDRKYYINYIMNLLGYSSSAEVIIVPKLSVENAKRITSLLSAGVSSSQIAIPTTVGSIRFHGNRGINLVTDESYKKLIDSIESIGVPTNDTMVESGFFSYACPKTGIIIKPKFEVNIKQNYFKFTTKVPEFVVDHVLDILIQVIIEEAKAQAIHETEMKSQIAATEEKTEQ